MKTSHSYHTIVLTTMFLLSACNNNMFKMLSKEVDEHYRQGRKTNMKTFHEVRMALYKEDKPAFLKSGFDTLFMLEEYSLEDAAYFGKIWNNRDSIIYKYQHGKFDYKISDPFTKHTSFLIHKWDTTGIRLEESLYSEMLPSQIIYGTRIAKQSKNYNIDTITFKKFYKLERDR